MSVLQSRRISTSQYLLWVMVTPPKGDIAAHRLNPAAFGGAKMCFPCSQAGVTSPQDGPVLSKDTFPGGHT